MATDEFQINTLNDEGQCVIQIAVEEDHGPALEALLEAGADPNVVNCEGDTPLHILLDRETLPEGWLDFLKQLIEAENMDINSVDARGRTPFIVALLREHGEAVEWLLKSGLWLDVDDKYENGSARSMVVARYPELIQHLPPQIPSDYVLKPILQLLRNNELSFSELLKGGAYNEKKDLLTAIKHKNRVLQHACIHNEIQAVDALLSCGADPNNIPSDNSYRDYTFPPICLAAINNCTDIVQLLLAQGAEVNKAEKDGKTTLYHAVWHGHEKIVKILLKNKAVDSTALHLAAKNGKENFVNMLLEHGDCVGKTDMCGNTALHIAVRNKNNSVVKMLVEHITKRNEQHNLDIKNRRGETALHYAVLDKNESVVEMLIKHKARADITNEFGRTALHCAVWYFNESIIKILIKYKADEVNRPDRQGQTPLYSAIWHRNESVVKMFLGYGAKVNTTDVYGRTALHFAARDGNESIVEMLLQHCSCANKTDIYGNTALFYAASINNKKIVSYLLKKLGPLRTDVLSILKTLENDAGEMYFDCNIITDRPISGSERYEVNLSFLTPPVTKRPGLVEQKRNRANNNVQETEKEHSESRFLVDMMEDPKLRPLLTHPVLTSFALLKWQRVQVFFFVNVLFQLLFCLSLTGYIMIGHFSVNDNSTSCNSTGQGNITSSVLLNETPSPSTIALRITTGVLLGFVFLREVIQLLLKFKSHFTNLENWLEVLILPLGIYAVVEDCSVLCSLESQSHNYFCPQVNAAVILLAWCDFILLVSRHPSFSVYIEMFQKVSKSFFFLLWRFIIILFGFASAFYILNLQSNDNVFNLWISVLKTFVMMTGEFNSNDLHFETYTITATLIFLLFVYFIAIVLMSLLNALAIDDIQKIRKDAYLYSSIARVKFISLFDEIFSEDNAFVAFFSQFECGKKLIICFKKQVTIFKDGHLSIHLEVSDSKVFFSFKPLPTLTSTPLTRAQVEPRGCISKFDLSNTEVKNIVSNMRNIVAKGVHDEDKEKLLFTENGKQTFNNSDKKCEQQLSALTQNIDKLLTICTDLQQRVQRLEDRSTHGF